MKSFAIVLLSAIATAGMAAKPPQAVGVYRLIPTAEYRKFCEKHSLPLPEGSIMLQPKGIFDYIHQDDIGITETRGSYIVAKGNKVVFTIEVGKGVGLPHTMLLSDAGLKADTLVYLRTDLTPGTSAGAAAVTPTFGATTQAAIPTPTPGDHSLEGTWTLRKGEREDVTTRFVLNADMTFHFYGNGASSSGRYSYSETGIELIYLAIDEIPLEAGVHMHKTLLWDEFQKGFQLDTYHYRKAEKG